MSMKESALYSGLSRGGCSLMGEDITPTLISRYETQIGNTQDKLNVICLNDQGGQEMSVTKEQTGTLRAQEHGHQPLVVEKPERKVWDWHRCDTRMTELKDVCNTASAAWGAGGNNMPYVEENTVVRRLTPMECERLQGYPDHWTDIGEWTDSKGKKHKDADSPRYKALGNSIALPFWEWMAGRMIAQLKEDGVDHPTMASLFDGISGFCLVYKRQGCEPVWTSEIEPFPIAVCKRHFGDEETGEVGDIEQFL